MALLWPNCQGRLERRRPFCLSAFMGETEADRKKRLAEALRANLRRRKAQAREGKPDAPPREEPAED